MNRDSTISPTRPESVLPPPDDTRLLAGWRHTRRGADLAAHHHRYGPLPLSRRSGQPARLIDEVAAAGLLGRGGAGFPTARKLAAVAAARGRPIVLANGCEGEPASNKDAALLALAPHLVLDGAIAAAHALGANEVTICVHNSAAAARTLPLAIAERRDPVPIRLVEIPARYVASEASALVHYLNTGDDARPTSTPLRAAQRGIRRRPTLVDNVETLAHLALITRYGADWFTRSGTARLPGTLLLTVGGAVRHRGVYEVPGGTTLATALHHAGGPTTPIQAILAGGYAGSWLPVPQALHTPLTHDDMRAAGATLGVAAFLALPTDACGLACTAHLLRYLADESAKQCGPCMFGLPAIATDLADLTAGHPDAPTVLARLRRRLAVIPGRGACAHPDGAVQLTASALRVFHADLAEHLDGRPCARAGDPPLFPLPRRSSGDDT